MKTLLFFLFALPPSLAHAFVGGSEGTGGGKGVVCRVPDGRVESVELLDLWEAREIYGRAPDANSGTLEEQLARAIARMKYSVQLGVGVTLSNYDGDFTEPEYLEFYLKKFSKMFTGDSKSLRRLRNTKLTLTNDSFEFAEPQGPCAIEQVVNFVDAPVFPLILVNQDLVDKMDVKNKAALYLHEAFYLYMRGYSSNLGFVGYREPDSQRVRRAIGYVFSGGSFESLEGFIAGRDTVQCGGSDAGGHNPSEFILYQDDSGESRLLTIQLFGRPAVGFFPNVHESVMPRDSIIENKSCNWDSRPLGMGPGSYGMAGSGPIDFQAYYWIGFDCQNGKQVPYLQQDTSTRFAADAAQRLSCRFVPAEKKPL